MNESHTLLGLVLISQAVMFLWLRIMVLDTLKESAVEQRAMFLLLARVERAVGTNSLHDDPQARQ